MEDFQNQNNSPTQNLSQGNPSQPQQVQKLKKHIPTWLGFLIIAITIILLFGGVFGFVFLKQSRQTACTTEAKICPDGSAVGRTGPNCEFTECPGSPDNNKTAGWKTYRNDKYGFETKFNPKWEIKYQENESLLYPEGAGTVEASEHIANSIYIQGITIEGSRYKATVLISVKQYPNNVSIEDSASGIFTSTDGNSSMISRDRITMADLVAYDEVVGFMEICRRTVLFAKPAKDGGSYKFSISLTRNDLAESCERDKMESVEFNEIISTFKFTKQEKSINLIKVEKDVSIGAGQPDEILLSGELREFKISQKDLTPKEFLVDGNKIILEAVEAHESSDVDFVPYGKDICSRDQSWCQNSKDWMIISINGTNIEFGREEIKQILFDNGIKINMVMADIEGSSSGYFESDGAFSVAK